ncbi:uncharacterized protein [Lolium perenne]|uniref:uncharacterized protein n=1 Tax=Lolium perenne TaxID=4522 RepID=UPI0021EB4BAA|nr:uncharacterized protein LOC127309237 [Lolium perenne]
MGCKKKKKAAGKMPPSKVQPSGKGMVAPTPTLIDVAVEALPAPTLPESDVPEKAPVCDACGRYLSPPVSQCSHMRHIACGDCAAGECGPCGSLGVAAVYFPNPYLDTLFGRFKVPCPFKKFGCGSSLACIDLRAHVEACGRAPFECFCCSDVLPAELLRHLTDKAGNHAWPSRNITYGTDFQFAINVKDAVNRCINFLFVAEEDGGLFLLRGYDEDHGVHSLDVVCIRLRKNTGSVYSSTVAVEGPLPKGLRHELKKKVIEICSGGNDPITIDMGEISPANACDVVWVHQEMLHGDDIHLCVRIDKV